MDRSPQPAAHILVVDDEEPIQLLLREYLERSGFVVECVSRGEAAITRIEQVHFDVVLLDLRMPGIGGLEVLRRAREIDESLSVIILTGYMTVDSAVKALKLGAEDYLLKPLDPDVLQLALARTIKQRRLQMEHRLLQQRMAALGGAREIIAHSKAMTDVLTLAVKVAPLRSTVLVQGESGTGKELLARALHEGSPRADRPFVAINCGVIPLSLLESELFGHERGAFTGAESRRIGYFEAAEGGTIFLDEIGETPLDLQVKLLRVLQERTFRRVGGVAEIGANVRVIASTNRDLEEEVRQGRFRHDLYYRLAVFTIRLPPLRERSEDISPLAYHFLSRCAREFQKTVSGISAAAMEILLNHPWPGNVRELENTIERAVALADGAEIRPGDLSAADSRGAAARAGSDGAPRRYSEARESFERAYLASLLEAAKGNMTEAARLSGVARQNLYRKLKRLGLLRSESSGS